MSSSSTPASACRVLRGHAQARQVGCWRRVQAHAHECQPDLPAPTPTQADCTCMRARRSQQQPSKPARVPAMLRSAAREPLVTPSSTLPISLGTRTWFVATMIFSSAPLFSSCRAERARGEKGEMSGRRPAPDPPRGAANPQRQGAAAEQPTARGIQAAPLGGWGGAHPRAPSPPSPLLACSRSREARRRRVPSPVGTPSTLMVGESDDMYCRGRQGAGEVPRSEGCRSCVPHLHASTAQPVPHASAQQGAPPARLCPSSIQCASFAASQRPFAARRAPCLPCASSTAQHSRTHGTVLRPHHAP